MKEKAVYINSIHGKTIQWETRNKCYSVINIVTPAVNVYINKVIIRKKTLAVESS